MPVITQWIGVYGCVRPSIKCYCLIEMLKLVTKLPLSSMSLLSLMLHFKCKSILFDVLIFYLVKLVNILVLPHLPLFTCCSTLRQCKCKTCIPQGRVYCKLHWHMADDLLSHKKGTKNVKCLLCTLEKKKRKRTFMPSLLGGSFCQFFKSLNLMEYSVSAPLE